MSPYNFTINLIYYGDYNIFIAYNFSILARLNFCHNNCEYKVFTTLKYYIKLTRPPQRYHPPEDKMVGYKIIHSTSIQFYTYFTSQII